MGIEFHKIARALTCLTLGLASNKQKSECWNRLSSTKVHTHTQDQNHFGADQNLCEKHYCDQANTKGGKKGRICAADSLLVYYNNQHRQLEFKVEIELFFLVLHQKPASTA